MSSWVFSLFYSICEFLCRKMLRMSRKTIPGLLLILLTAASFGYADQKTVEVVGFGECADCLQKNITNSHAVKGLKVTIDCKHGNGEMKTRGAGELDEEGKFRVEVPQELVENGKLKEECYARLHSASDILCPPSNGVESSKIAFVSESDGKHTFSPVAKLKFSPLTCTSAFLWPFPKLHFPKFSFPENPFFKKPFPSIPKFKKPIPCVPIFKKRIPHVPILKKPLPPHVPIHKKPLPHVKIHKKPLPPHPHLPIFKKPFPHPIPVFKKPIPLPFPKFPPHPQFPPKFFHLPKFKYFPFFPHHPWAFPLP